jgi:hypothetical protein
VDTFPNEGLELYRLGKGEIADRSYLNLQNGQIVKVLIGAIVSSCQDIYSRNCGSKYLFKINYIVGLPESFAPLGFLV